MVGYLGGHRARDWQGRVLMVAVVTVMLVAGVVLGIRFGPGLLSHSDELTWLGDSVRGEAVQVNPDTGRQENRLKVANAGNQIELAQLDELLVVTDATTGTLTVIDASALVTGGRWFGSGGAAVEVLLDANGLYVVDRARGAVQRLDPQNARPIGAAWNAGGLIADAALDGDSKIWALRNDGRLSALVWSPESGTLAETAPPVRVKGAGPRSQVVPHTRGVTVVASEAGVISRVGTGDDTVVEIPPVPGKINPAPQAPPDLVPVSAADSGKVLLFQRARAVTIETGGMGCDRPGQPVVFHGRVYVGCGGAGKVLVLGRDGQRWPDIRVPAGAPKFTIDDDKLFIHVDGADTGVVVGGDGKVTSAVTHDETRPVNDPDNPPPANGKPPSKGPRQSAGAGPSPSKTPAGPKVPAAPTGVSIAPAQPPANGEAVVTGVSVEETTRTSFRGEASFNPPFAWRTFEGSCTLNYAGPATGSRPVNCWATSLSFTFTGGAGTYRFWMQAGSVKSNEVQVLGYHEPPELPPPCPRCQIP